jgi:hypothetical protein
MVTVDLLTKGRLVRTFPNRPAGNRRPLTLEKSMQCTGCFKIKGQFQASKDQERFQKLRDCKHFLDQDRRFHEVARLIETVEPGPDRVKAIDDFWNSVYGKFQWEERERC